MSCEYVHVLCSYSLNVAWLDLLDRPRPILVGCKARISSFNKMVRGHIERQLKYNNVEIVIHVREFVIVLDLVASCELSEIS